MNHDRSYGRSVNEMRPVSIERDVSEFAEGSCLISFGQTRVFCTASVQEGVPSWRKGTGAGWVTAEYAMLPRATHERTSRERGHIGGRTQEIQRLVGRSLRACVDLEALGEWTIRVDCDVLQADGGTRTAAVTGGAVALHEACSWIVRKSGLAESPFQDFVAAVSAGIVGGEVLLDLDYSEDSRADVDLNIVAFASGDLIEVQGTGERTPFSPSQLTRMVELASEAVVHLAGEQRSAVA